MTIGLVINAQSFINTDFKRVPVMIIFILKNDVIISVSKTTLFFHRF